MTSELIHVLLVEDNPAEANLVQTLLAASTLRDLHAPHFHLKWVNRLGAGIEYAAAGDVDVVLLDLNLPDTQGLETLLQARLAMPQMPIVIMTNVDSTALQQEAIRVGAQDYLLKDEVDSPLLARVLRYAIERKGAEDRLRQAYDKLEQRVVERTKELNCLYRISALVEQPGISLPEILQGTVDLLPPAYQYPEIACARLVLRDRTYQTANFAPTPWRQRCKVVVQERTEGTIEVCYLAERLWGAQDPFLTEEQDMLRAIAKRLGRIIERIEAKDALQAQRDTLATIFENAPYILMLVNQEGRVENINRQGVRFVGRPKEELLGLLGGEVFSCLNSFDGLGCGRNAACRDCPVRRRVTYTLQSGEPSLEEEGQLTVRQGAEEITLELLISTSRIKVNGADKVLLAIADITARKQAEEALRQALEHSQQREAEIAALLSAARAVLENRLFDDTAQSIFQACKEAIGATAGYVALLNESGEENEVLFLDSGGLPCSVDPELPMPIRGLRAEAYRSGQPVYDNQFARSAWTQYLPDGHVEMQNVLFAPLMIEGKAAGLLGLANKPHGFGARDAQIAAAFSEIASVALQNSLNLQALEESRATLLRSNADLEHFAYVVSHDLNEPLRMISSYLSLLDRRYGEELDETAREFIAYAVDGAQRLHEMIKAILDYSRIGAQGEAVTPTDCDALLTQILTRLQLVIQESGAVVTRDPLPVIMADEAQLAQVLQNLIANALKFRGAQSPRVHISARRHGDKWLLSVRDNGIGIDPQSSERIFLMFQRLHTQAEYPGSGIGLALCRRIVERHGGRIWVESQPGEGSTFYFTLPAIRG